MGNQYRPWTAEDDRRLLELRAVGRSAISIAAALKRTKSAVTHRLQSLRVRSAQNRATPQKMAVQDDAEFFNAPPAEISSPSQAPAASR
jgi:hypothetical protein